MSGTHKNATMSFRPTTYERVEIEAKIAASGMQKNRYIIHSCIYNHVVVVGKKETVIAIVEELQIMDKDIREIADQLNEGNISLTKEGMEEMTEAYTAMVKAILWMLEGAKDLIYGKEKN